MLDIGWPELLVLLIIALVVIGPKDLPKAMYTMGKWVRAIRRMTGQMQKQFDDAMREAELDDIKDKLKSANKYNIRKQVEGAIDPKGQIKKSFDIGEGKSVKQFLSDGTADPKAEGKPAGGEAGQTSAGDTSADDGEQIRQRKLAGLSQEAGSRDVGDENADKVAIAGVQEDGPAPEKASGAKTAGAASSTGQATGETATKPRKAGAKTAGSQSGKSKPAAKSATAKSGGPAAPSGDAAPSEDTAPGKAAGGTSAKAGRSATTPPRKKNAQKETVPTSSGGGE